MCAHACCTGSGGENTLISPLLKENIGEVTDKDRHARVQEDDRKEIREALIKWNKDLSLNPSISDYKERLEWLNMMKLHCKEHFYRCKSMLQ